MGDIRNVLSNDVRYVLKSDVLLKSLYLDGEPIGWKDDDFKLDRHKDYHGIFYSYTGSLSFKDDALDYIENSYKIGGINTNLYLRKEILREVDGEVKWVVRYRAKGDFSTKEIKNQQLTLNFNSLELAELMKSHESDEFEIDLEESIDGVDIGELETNSITLEGRELLLSGEVKNYDDEDTFGYNFPANPLVQIVPATKLISTSIDIFQATSDLAGVVLASTNNLEIVDIEASSMFLQREAEDNGDRVFNIRYDFDFLGRSYTDGGSIGGENLVGVFVKYLWNPATSVYDIQPTTEDRILFSFSASEFATQYRVNDTITITKKYNEAYAFIIQGSYLFAKFDKLSIIASERSFFERSVGMRFVFTHDLINRLMRIITGRNDAFYSKLLGNTTLLDDKGEAIYSENGDFGLIGNISGWWARGFVKGSEKYKSLTISLKDTLDSLKAIGNTGIGIETINFKERLRVEELGYFYQNQTVVKFPNQVTDVSRVVDDSLFFSGLTLGYQYGGDYENELGLDEPNTTSEFITPIRKSSNKYTRISKIRADDTGLEITRRKPQTRYPTEDTERDDSIWWLDVKKENPDDISYTQKTWLDRLQKAPTGIFSPDTFFGMFFTPRVIMKRHAWVFTSGMIPYLIKKIRHISSKANDTLTMLFEDESVELSESSDVYVRDLSRPKLLPEIITCSHPIDYDLMDWITGTTRVEINGKSEDVPNYYFKMQITNEYGDKEKVYLLNCDPTGVGTLVFQKAYE